MSKITVTKCGIYKEIESGRLAELRQKGFIEVCKANASAGDKMKRSKVGAKAAAKEVEE